MEDAPSYTGQAGGHCITYGQCGEGFNNGKLNCLSNTSALQVTDADDLEILRDFCPQIYKGEYKFRNLQRVVCVGFWGFFFGGVGGKFWPVFVCFCVVISLKNLTVLEKYNNSGSNLRSQIKNWSPFY